ncbi:MAG: hypothetical protein ACHQ03_02195 [Candidatus Bathyarchaeia archaeon]
MSESDQCPLCERRKEQSSEFCELHRSALEKIGSAYSAWNKGYGDLTKQTYYDKLEDLNETGRAVKEIIQYFKTKERVE